MRAETVCAYALYARDTFRRAPVAIGRTTPAYSLRIARCRDSRGQQRGARVHKLGTGARHRHAAARGGHAPPAHPSDPRGPLSAVRSAHGAAAGKKKPLTVFLRPSFPIPSAFPCIVSNYLSRATFSFSPPPTRDRKRQRPAPSLLWCGSLCRCVAAAR